MLAATLKGLIINNSGYYVSDSANANDEKVDLASYPKVATHTSDRNKRKVTDTSNGDLQQKLLSNQTLPIINTMIGLCINDRVVTPGASLTKLPTPQVTKCIMDAAHSNAQKRISTRSNAQQRAAMRKFSRLLVV